MGVLVLEYFLRVAWPSLQITSCAASPMRGNLQLHVIISQHPFGISCGWPFMYRICLWLDSWMWCAKNCDGHNYSLPFCNACSASQLRKGYIILLQAVIEWGHVQVSF